MPRSRVRTNGLELAYDDLGDPAAPVMVLLHGLGEQAAGWAPVLDRFIERHRVIALDLRGHGDSDWPGDYSHRGMAADVIGALDELGLSGVVLVGHSLGAAVGYLVAMERPDLVSRLVVEDAPPPYRRDRPVPERPDWEVPFDWPVVPAIIAEVNEGDPQAWEGLTRITARTLMIAGGVESHIPQERLADAAARIPDCTLVTIDAGHFVHTKKPIEFADAVLGWLDR